MGIVGNKQIAQELVALVELEIVTQEVVALIELETVVQGIIPDLC